MNNPTVYKLSTPNDSIGGATTLLDSIVHTNYQSSEHNTSRTTDKSLFDYHEFSTTWDHISIGKNRDLASKLEPVDAKIAKRLRICGAFKIKRICECCKQSKVIVTSKCNMRLCPSCSKDISNRMYNKYYPRLKEYTNDKYGYFVTLTFMSTDKTPDQQTWSTWRSNFSQFYKDLSKSREYPLMGGIAKLELFSDSSCYTFNPHIHALMFFTQKIDTSSSGIWSDSVTEEMKSKWESITETSHVVQGEAN